MTRLRKMMLEELQRLDFVRAGELRLVDRRAGRFEMAFG